MVFRMAHIIFRMAHITMTRWSSTSLSPKWPAPLLVPGTATLIKSPHYSWETDGQAVVEGPAVVEMNDTYYLMYSAGASWTMYYSTSVMGLDALSDPLKASSWWRSDKPVFPRNEAEGVYGPGHASFTVSPDGKEHWIVYHALDDPVSRNSPFRYTTIFPIFCM